VWLDRGELDKIIEKSIKEESELSEQSKELNSQARPIEVVRHYPPDHGHRDQFKYKRRKSLLEELFD
jgi:Zn-finger nucleic acid-binding protein